MKKSKMIAACFNSNNPEEAGAAGAATSSSLVAHLHTESAEESG